MKFCQNGINVNGEKCMFYRNSGMLQYFMSWVFEWKAKLLLFDWHFTQWLVAKWAWLICVVKMCYLHTQTSVIQQRDTPIVVYHQNSIHHSVCAKKTYFNGMFHDFLYILFYRKLNPHRNNGKALNKLQMFHNIMPSLWRKIFDIVFSECKVMC